MTGTGAATTLRADLGEVCTGDVVRYAGASGDFNPIHYDTAFAKASGVPGVFAMGMMTAAWAARWVESELSAATVSAFEMRFTERVWPGDRLQVEATRSSEGVEGSVLRGSDAVLTFGARRVAGGEADALVRGELLAGPFRWVVEEGAVRDFRRAARDESAVTPGDVAPLTFLATMHRWSPLGDRLLEHIGFDQHRLLHGSTSIEFSGGPLRVGEELRGEQWMEPRRTKPGRRGGAMTFVDVVEVVRDLTGALRARTTTTLIELPVAPLEVPDGLRLDPPRLVGSRDPQTRMVFFPPRALGVDGGMRECEMVELSSQGVLFSYAQLSDDVYGWVDLPEGVRVQSRLGGEQHDIGATYRLDVLAVDGTLRWRFVRA